MRKLLFILISTFICSAYAHAQNNPKNEASDAVEVIGWFCKHDTTIYSINQSNWRICGPDTTMLGSTSMKVRIVVTDSTSNGYNMEYTFLDLQQDPADDNNPYSNIQSVIVETFGKSMVGTTVKFETNDCGEITKILNMGQIKQQVKSMFNESLKKLMDMPEMQHLKAAGINLERLTKLVDTEQLVDDYLSELNLIFAFHGKAFGLGLKQTHSDATETEFENDTFITALVNSEDDTYAVSTEVINIVPHESLDGLMGDVIKIIADKNAAEKFRNEVISKENYTGAITSYLSANYFSDGWPYRIVLQESTSISDHSKLTQKYIILEAISTHNY